MATWLETCQEQLARLEITSVLADKLVTLCSMTGEDIAPELAQKLTVEHARLNRQLERLHANRFEVAVIGLEKAGQPRQSTISYCLFNTIARKKSVHCKSKDARRWRKR
jgi:hypothetical protein